MQVVPSGSPLPFEVDFGASGLFVSMEVTDITGSPNVVANIPMNDLGTGQYTALFTPVVNKQYSVLKQVFTDGTYVTPDPGYNSGSESFGVIASASSLVVSDIVNGVWNEVRSGHNGAGTFGAIMSFLDATVSSRASESLQLQIAGVGFNPSEDSLVALAAVLATLATTSQASAIFSAVGDIPTNPVLVTDSRLAHLDAAITSRASDNDMQLVKGSGFSTSEDSLYALSQAFGGADFDLAPVLSALAVISGAGFTSGVDDLHSSHSIETAVLDQIYSAVQALLTQGVGT